MEGTTKNHPSQRQCMLSHFFESLKETKLNKLGRDGRSSSVRQQKSCRICTKSLTTSSNKKIFNFRVILSKIHIIVKKHSPSKSRSASRGTPITLTYKSSVKGSVMGNEKSSKHYPEKKQRKTMEFATKSLNYLRQNHKMHTLIRTKSKKKCFSSTKQQQTSQICWAKVNQPPHKNPFSDIKTINSID